MFSGESGLSSSWEAPSGAMNGFEPGGEKSQISDDYSSYGSHSPSLDYAFPGSQALDFGGYPASLGVGGGGGAAAGGDDAALEFTEINSDISLAFISRMLMEEDMEDKVYLHREELTAAEKPFYDILRGEDGSAESPDRPPLYSSGSPNDSGGGSSSVATAEFNPAGSDETAGGVLLGENYHAAVIVPEVSDSSSDSRTRAFEDLLQSLGGPFDGGTTFSDVNYQRQFNKGMEEASKFLPDSSKLVIDLESTGFFSSPKAGPEAAPTEVVTVKAEHKIEDDDNLIVNLSKGRKSHNDVDLELEEGRSRKQTAVSSNNDEVITTAFLDSVLLGRCGASKYKNATTTPVVAHGAASQNGASKNGKNSSLKGKSKGKKQGKTEVVDLRTSLIVCAQSISSNDHRSAHEQLKQIRQHASPTGDGMQRLAHYFADGLEARLAGTGSQVYRSLMAKKTTSVADMLKAYHLYMSSSPFKKISFFCANQTYLAASEKAMRVHIIDFGIGFGFQWPCLIHQFSLRREGPPMLRITGIDLPQPGFRPAERLEETGKRLADYAQRFGVPFDYQAIACKWENLNIEDLKLDENEVLVVNSIYQFRNLADETVAVECPRNIVLNKIKQMNPAVFVLGIMNGAYGAPFFMTRFREALFHFSALFDMLEDNASREDPQRQLIEREIFGHEAMNVIACEGIERLHRPETYKQWHGRNLRIGLEQLAFNPDLLKRGREKLQSCYNKDFLIGEDSKWLLLGWKGRVIYALSKWKAGD